MWRALRRLLRYTNVLLQLEFSLIVSECMSTNLYFKYIVSGLVMLCFLVL